MTAEQLNIKINLDIASLKNSAKQVKQSLAGMTNEIKQSLPRLNRESKEASGSLNKAARAGKEVKKSLEDIGREAKESLGSVSTQANKMTAALQRASIFSNTSVIGSDSAESVELTSESLSQMQGTMQNIMGLNFADLIIDHFDGIKKSVGSAVEEVKALYGGLVAPIKIKKIINNSELRHQIEAIKNIKNMADAMDYDILSDMPDFAEEYDSVIKLEKELNGGMQKRAWKQFSDSLKTASKNALALIGNLTLLTTVVGAVAAVISSFGVAKMGKEIYVGAQRAGMSAQKYQEWQYVLERCGIEADELTEVIKTLTEAQIDVINADEGMTKAFAQLGMSMEDVKGMGQDELFERTVAALQNVQDTTQRTAIAYKVFGEDAAKLTTVLRLSNQETSQLISTYNTLGGAMSQELIEKSNRLQSSLTNLRSAWQGLRNTLAEAILPVLIKVVDWLVKAIVVVNTFIKAVFGINGTPANNNGLTNITAGAGAATDAFEDATAAAEKLKRTTMSFDELNIVGNPNASGGSTGADSGSLSIPDVGSMVDTNNSIFSNLDGEIEAIKQKVEAFVEKFRPQIELIGKALAALSVAQLLEGLGKAIGLGEGFLGVMSKIKSLAASAIVITLQYSMVNEYLDKYIDGEGFKNYLKAALVAAIGTGVLYAMWGPAGLVIGLGVTAVAAIKSVIDNGGITNIESAVVGLSGIAAAIAAIGLALKKTDLGAFFALLKEGHGLIPTLAAAFPKLSGAIGAFVTMVSTKFPTVAKVFGTIGGTISKAIGGLSGIITKALGGLAAAVAAIPGWAIALIAAIAAAITLAIVDYDFTDIGYKLGHALGTAWKNIKDWFKGVGDWFVSLGQSIKEQLSKACDWVAEKFDFLEEIDLKDLFKLSTWTEIIFPEMVKIGKEVLNGIVQGIKDAWNNFWGNIREFIDGFVQGWKDALGIQSPSKVFAEIGKYIIEGLLNGIKTAWNNVVNWFKTSVAPKFTKEYWNAKFESVRAAANEKLNAAKTVITNIWNGVVSWFKTAIAPKFTKAYWNTKFDTIRASAQEKLNAAKSAITGVWNTVSSWFKTSVAPKFTVSYWTTKFNTIKDGARAAFNGVISVVERAVNGIINKINTLSWKIPDWVPVYGGDRFGFNMRTISIPRLAEGGIAMSSTLANIGEAGKEAILPLENNTGWMDALADKIAARQGTAPTKVVLELDGRELGWAAINNMNRITKETGGLKLALL